jgi:hypothetical protein
MQVIACTSFSIATSTERMAMGAHSRGTLAPPGLLTGPPALTAVSVLAVFRVVADLLPAGNKLTRHRENCVCRLCRMKRRMQMRAVQVRDWPAASFRLYGGVIIDR